MNISYLSLRICKISALIMLFPIVAHAVAQGTSYPDMKGIIEPTTNYPGSFSEFRPPVDKGLTVLPNAPQIAEWTRQNQPGDTMIITGEDFSSFTNSYSGVGGYAVAFKGDGIDDYIDTGIVPAANIFFEIDGIWPTSQSSYHKVSGTKGAGHSALLIGAGYDGFRFEFGSTSSVGAFDNSGLRAVAYVDRNKYGLNGVYKAWSPTITFNDSQSAFLFHSPGYYGSEYSDQTIYRATIGRIDTGEILFNAIARSDGTFYDTVSKKVLTNLGTGNLSVVKEGENIPSTSGEYGMDTAFLLFGQSGINKTLSSGLILRQNGQVAAVTVPDALPDNQLYLMWPRNNAGYGSPVAINKPQGWMVLPKYATKGEAFSVYGRNLVSDKDAPVSYVYVEETGDWWSSTNANPYKADYKIPTGYSTGTYTLWPHNGTGGKYGWGDPVEIIVNSDLDWSLGKRLELSSYGGVGDGVKDNYAAFAAAINAAQPGDTIHIGDGTFAISRLLPTMENVRLLGNGKTNTVITSHANWTPSQGSDRMLPRKMVNVELSDLTFDGGIYRSTRMILYPIDAGCARLVCNQVKFTTESDPSEYRDGTYINLDHCEDVVFRDCDFISGSSVDIGNSSVLFERCHFYGMYDVGLFIVSKAGNEVSVSECSAQNLDDADARSWRGWCQGRFFHGQGLNGAVKNTYFGGNRTFNLTPRLPEPWVTEQPSAVTANSFTFTASGVNQCDDSLYDKYAIVTGGTGASATKYKISDINKTTGVVTLEGGWATQPNTSSTIEIIDAINNRNTGEQWMCEFSDTNWRELAESATSNTVTLASLDNNYDGDIVTIIDGRGFGQSRIITGDSSSGTVTVTQPWNVIPDTTSLIAIGDFVYRGAIYGNYFEGTDLAVEGDEDVAVEGVSTYGGHVEICVENNTFHKMREGTTVWGNPSKVSDQSPGEYIYRQNYFNHYENNRYEGCRHAIITYVTYRYYDPLPVKLDKTVFGHVYRRNTITDTFKEAVVYAVEVGGPLGMEVFDGNTITGFSRFMQNSDGLADQVWINNSVNSANGGTAMVISDNHVPTLHGNSWNGFIYDYGGELPGPVLEVPTRFITVSNGTHNIALFNNGTDSLYWEASASPNNWVSLITTNDVIEPEKSGLLDFNVYGVHETPVAPVTITIKGANQAQQITLIYGTETSSISTTENATRIPYTSSSGGDLWADVTLLPGGETIRMGPWPGSGPIVIEGLDYDVYRVEIYEEISPGVFNYGGKVHINRRR